MPPVKRKRAALDEDTNPEPRPAQDLLSRRKRHFARNIGRKRFATWRPGEEETPFGPVTLKKFFSGEKSSLIRPEEFIAEIQTNRERYPGTAGEGWSKYKTIAPYITQDVASAVLEELESVAREYRGQPNVRRRWTTRRPLRDWQPNERRAAATLFALGKYPEAQRTFGDKELRGALRAIEAGTPAADVFTGADPGFSQARRPRGMAYYREQRAGERKPTPLQEKVAGYISESSSDESADKPVASGRQRRKRARQAQPKAEIAATSDAPESAADAAGTDAPALATLPQPLSRAPKRTALAQPRAFPPVTRADPFMQGSASEHLDE